MGTTVRLIADAPLEPIRAGIEALAARLTRFDPRSELCALNADPRAEVPASPLLRRAVQAALLGARRTGGLADPTLLDAVEAAGYARSRAGVAPASLDAALRGAPPRRPATPGRHWEQIRVGEATVTRPPGLRIDLGGSAKGLAADWAASRLRGRYVVDCGGDVRVGGTHDVALRGTAHTLRVADGAVATSGIDRRVWRCGDGSHAHHLLDPGTGEPAWTGLISATALAPTALEAEALAKAALLSGPRGARRLLAAAGGIVVHDDGRSEVVAAAVGRRSEVVAIGRRSVVVAAAVGGRRVAAAIDDDDLRVAA
jgi:thiamine biosynthesis lipoprotein